MLPRSMVKTPLPVARNDVVLVRARVRRVYPEQGFAQVRLRTPDNVVQYCPVPLAAIAGVERQPLPHWLDEILAPLLDDD
jgi:hypothetical protein